MGKREKKKDPKPVEKKTCPSCNAEVFFLYATAGRSVCYDCKQTVDMLRDMGGQ